MAKATEFSLVSLFLWDISIFCQHFSLVFFFGWTTWCAIDSDIFALSKKKSQWFQGLGIFLISHVPPKKWLLENSGWSTGWLPGPPTSLAKKTIGKWIVVQWWICYTSKKDTKWTVKWTESFPTLVLLLFVSLCFSTFIIFWGFPRLVPFRYRFSTWGTGRTRGAYLAPLAEWITESKISENSIFHRENGGKTLGMV